jgi:hypothetical protein
MTGKSQCDGERVYGTGRMLHQGAGKLVGYLASHNEEIANLVTFYDSLTASGTVLHRVWIPAGEVIYIRFGMSSSRVESIPFSTGLSVDPGSCDVAVWSTGYG